MFVDNAGPSWVLLKAAFTSPRLEPAALALAADCLLMGAGILLPSTRNGGSVLCMLSAPTRKIWMSALMVSISASKASSSKGFGGPSATLAATVEPFEVMRRPSVPT